MKLQPFSINIPQAALNDLKDRLARTNWPEHCPLGMAMDWSRGVPVSYMKETG